jgi:hypothetical protein
VEGEGEAEGEGGSLRKFRGETGDREGDSGKEFWIIASIMVSTEDKSSDETPALRAPKLVSSLPEYLGSLGKEEWRADDEEEEEAGEGV